MTDGTAIELAGSRVLVTGGAGFIGSHLVEAIADVARVTVLDDLSAGRRERLPEDVGFVEADLRDEDVLSRTMADVDVVVHLGAVVSVERSIERPPASHSINVDGTLRVLECARREDARVVFASSAAVYGPQDDLPIAEDDPKRPRSPYGIGKLAAGDYCRRYNDLYGLDTVALRFFNVYGPGQSGGQYAGVIDVFRRQALADEALTVHGDGSQTRDFVHVSDVVRAVVLAATTEQVGEAYNVATGSETSIEELARLVRRSTGASVPIRRTDAREGDIDRSCADVGKAARRLEFESTVSIEDGLRGLLEGSTPAVGVRGDD